VVDGKSRYLGPPARHKEAARVLAQSQATHDVRDPPSLADPAARGDVELDELHGVRGDQLAEPIEAVLGLVAADGDRAPGLDARLPGQGETGASSQWMS
jgi:hypothetical protein